MQVDVSVVMPLYNAKDYLKLAVDSILNQTHKNIELVVVDDCSTDGSLDLCRELYGQDARVRIIQQPRNMGPGAARNTGIRSARGEYITLVDSDDEILPDMVSRMFETAKQFSADVVHNTQVMFPLPDEEGYIPLQLIDDSVRLFPNGHEHNTYRQVSLLPEDLPAKFDIWSNRKIGLGVFNKMYRREFLVDNGIFFSDMRLAEDMVFCFECLCKCKNYVMLPGGGYVYRVIGTSLSRGRKSSANVIKALKSQIECIHTMRRILSGIPFFVEHPDKAKSALERALYDLEVAYIRPAYQELGEDMLRSDNLMREFMQEEFGGKAPYVEFLFYQLHKLYEPVEDSVKQLGDIEFWKAIAQTIREKEQSK